MKMLCFNGKGFWNRSWENRSIGPTRITLLVVFRKGSKVIDVASPYNFVGENKEMVFRTCSCLNDSLIASGPFACFTGTTASDIKPAATGTRNEENIHNAKAARADVDVLLKITEKKIEIASQKAI